VPGWLCRKASQADALVGLQGDRFDENTAEASYVIDGNPATAWQAQYYVGSPVFGVLKKATGPDPGDE